MLLMIFCLWVPCLAFDQIIARTECDWTSLTCVSQCTYTSRQCNVHYGFDYVQDVTPKVYPHYDNLSDDSVWWQAAAIVALRTCKLIVWLQHMLKSVLQTCLWSDQHPWV